MVPGGQWRSVGETLNVVAGYAAVRAEIDRTSDEIVLVITANKQCLAAGQVEVESSDVGIQFRWRARVEAKAAGVQTIADGCIVGGITLRCGCEHRQSIGIDARIT